MLADATTDVLTNGSIANWSQLGAVGVCMAILCWLIFRRMPEQERQYREDILRIVNEFTASLAQERQYRHEAAERCEAGRKEDRDEFRAALQSLVEKKGRQ